MIGLNLCPFAAQPFRQDSIRYTACEDRRPAQCLENLIDECRYLDHHESTNTTLLIYPNAFRHFDDYLDFVASAEALLNEQGYEGIYQLATFHPDYSFADSNNNDPANYTNRSPYPMLHLLREDRLESVLKNYPDPEGIPERNMEKLRRLGLPYMQQIVAKTL